MLFDEVLSKANLKSEFKVPKFWTQGRTVYGGLTAAMLVKVLAEQVNANKQLRVLNVAFAAPSFADKAIRQKAKNETDAPQLLSKVDRLIAEIQSGFSQS